MLTPFEKPARNGRRQTTLQSLDELADSLPNGLHDAELAQLSVDYVARTVDLRLRIWIGDMSSDDEEVRERYRNARITVSGLEYCAIEPPCPSYPYERPKPLWIDSGPIASLKPRPSALPAGKSAGTSIHWIYVQEWNTCLYLAARSAEIEWLDE